MWSHHITDPPAPASERLSSGRGRLCHGSRSRTYTSRLCTSYIASVRRQKSDTYILFAWDTTSSHFQETMSAAMSRGDSLPVGHSSVEGRDFSVRPAIPKIFPAQPAYRMQTTMFFSRKLCTGFSYWLKTQGCAYQHKRPHFAKTEGTVSTTLT